MPTGFTEPERKRISATLRRNATELFATQGLRKTSLEELMLPTGVAKSSFYLFFGSKEELYLELMLAQAREVETRVIDGALHTTDDPREGLRRFLQASLEELRVNPLWRRLTTHPGELQAVAEKLTPERLAEMTAHPAAALEVFLERQRAAGALVASPKIALGVLQCVLLVPLFADRLANPDSAPEIIDLLVKLVAAGLTVPGS